MDMLALRVQPRQVLIVGPDGRISYGVYNPEEKLIRPGVWMDMTVDDYDCEAISRLTVHQLMLICDDRWIDIPLEGFPGTFELLRGVYQTVSQQLLADGIHLYTLPQRREFKAFPVIPGH